MIYIEKSSKLIKNIRRRINYYGYHVHYINKEEFNLEGEALLGLVSYRLKKVWIAIKFKPRKDIAFTMLHELRHILAKNKGLSQCESLTDCWAALELASYFKKNNIKNT